MQINLLQCKSNTNVDGNMTMIKGHISHLSRNKDELKLVVLPECCLLFGGSEDEQRKWAGSLTHGDGAIVHTSEMKTWLSDLARQYQLYLVAGTIPALASDGRIYSRCYMFEPSGKVIGHYDKLHLFDANVADNTGLYRESDVFCPGENICVVNTPFGRIGLAICYDLRFPDVFRALRLAGAEIIAIPSAFTAATGKAHWQTLIQARALDSQCFILAANQYGQHHDVGRETWGHSAIIDPWGQVVSQLNHCIGWVHAPLDLTGLTKVRQSFPLVEHNRFSKPTLTKSTLK